MGHERAIDWLGSDPAAAAEFLARTTVASRRVGGFVKHAAPDWRQFLNDLGNNHDARNALIGAGVGGLGGLGIGLANRRRKNPLTAALTGAALGGLGTGAASYLYNHPDFLRTSPDAVTAASDQEKQKIEAFKDAPYLRQLAAKYLDWDVPIEDKTPVAAGGAGGPAPATLTGAKAKLNPMVAGAGALGATTLGAARGIGSALYGDDWSTRGIAGVGSAVGAAVGRLAQSRWDDFSKARRATQAFEKGMAGFDLSSFGRGREGVGPGLQALRDRAQVAQGGQPTGLFGGLGAARHEAGVGRDILNLEARGGPIREVIGNPAFHRTIPPPTAGMEWDPASHRVTTPTPGFRSSDIGDVLARGEFQRNVPRGPVRQILPTLSGGVAGAVGGRLGEHLARNLFGWGG